MNAYIALGYACNHRCVFCPCGKESERKFASSISVDEFQTYVDQICRNSQIQSITLSGGEPTLQKHFTDFLDILSKTHLQVGVLTNSDYLSIPEVFQKVVKHANPRQVHFTTALHSHQAEKHDNVTQVAGSFQRSVTTLQRLMQLNYAVSIKHVIHQDSYQTLPNYLATMLQLFPKSNVSFNLCGMDYCGMEREAIARTKVSFQELSCYLEQALHDFEKRNIANHFLKVTELPLCTVDPYYWKYFSYSQKQTLSAYASPVVKNTDQSRLRFNVESDCDTFSESCQQCIVKHLCPGLWRSAWQLFGNQAVNAIK